MQLVVAGWTDELTGRDSRIKVVERLDSVHTLLATPRYDEFRDVLLDLARTAAPLRIVEVAGNEEILLTGVAPSDWTFPGDHGELVYSLPLPTDSTRKRIAIRMPTPALLDFLRVLQTEGRATVDHIYDY
jgi:hypothetical protein